MEKEPDMANQNRNCFNSGPSPYTQTLNHACGPEVAFFEMSVGPLGGRLRLGINVLGQGIRVTAAPTCQDLQSPPKRKFPRYSDTIS